MARTAGTIRSEVILRMKGAIEAGKTASAFLREMQAADLGYRRTDFLSDWRSVGEIGKKDGLLKYVRKTYQPSPELYAEVGWNVSREYMYKIRVETRIRPREPIESRFVNIVTDRPMTPGELELEVQRAWGTWYPERREQIERVIPETAIKRV